MAEVPSFLFEMDKLNELAIDGYSIGSNDLTQLMFAVGRDNQFLSDPDNFLVDRKNFNEKEPAVKSAMKQIVEKAKEGNKTCSICGESASRYPEVVKELVEAGIDSISVSPGAVEESKELVEKFEGS